MTLRVTRGSHEVLPQSLGIQSSGSQSDAAISARAANGLTRLQRQLRRIGLTHLRSSLETAAVKHGKARVLRSTLFQATIELRSLRRNDRLALRTVSTQPGSEHCSPQSNLSRIMGHS